MAINSTLLCRIIVDIILLLCLGIPMLTLELAVTPYTRGFFCYDETIMHPFKDSTIPTIVLVIVGLGLPVISILAVEAINYYKSKHGSLDEKTQYDLGCTTVSSWMWNSYKTIGIFLFGAGVNQDLTDACKYTVGRLRPHFLTVCDPDFSKLNCSQHLYITDDVCRGTNTHLIKEARLSFPSGHASMSAYTMIFLILFLQSRLHVPFCRLLKPSLQAIVFFFAIGTTLSRISDYKHHPLDVTGGFILGTTIAVTLALYVSDLFPHYKRSNLRQRSQDLELGENASKYYGTTAGESPQNENPHI